MSVKPVAGWIRELRLRSGFAPQRDALRIENFPDHRGGDIPVSILPCVESTLAELVQGATQDCAVAGWSTMSEEERSAFVSHLVAGLMNQLGPKS